MQHVLLGYGYVAKFLALELSQAFLPILAFSRTKPIDAIRSLSHQYSDEHHKLAGLSQDYVLYYFIPPKADSLTDTTLEQYLQQLSHPPQKIIYIGSSGIYGDHHGEWIDEESPLKILTPRQQGRHSAEILLANYAMKHHLPLARLRVAGIYGPGRLPLEASKQQSPLIYPDEAPMINHIYVKDLAKILALLGTSITYHGILNICDGKPHPMGYLQELTARYFGYHPSTYQHFQDIYAQASAMKKEFMSQNKQLNSRRLHQLLQGTGINLHDLESGIKDCLDNSPKNIVI